ncbi:hypothetical protein AB0D04_11205 [Streptomyces sp. NPDC048483]|uniref:hypothetical protein n=1 Tax=Streptomyces sp. NPDC048483 TaxID=3154927 RepID=UPI0034463175
MTKFTDVIPPWALRMILVWVLVGVALAGVSPRRERQQLMGLMLRTVIPLLVFLSAAAVPWAVGTEFPAWWDRWWTYVLPVISLLFGLVLWLPLHGARLGWRGKWDFPYPLATPSDVTADGAKESPTHTPASVDGRQLAVPRYAGVQLLGWLILLLGLAVALGAMKVMATPLSYPRWLASNAFLLLVSGGFIYLHGRNTLRFAGTRRSRSFPSLPARENAWVGMLLWVAAWLCCLAGLALTLGAMTAMVDGAHYPAGATFIAFPLMLIGGGIFTQGRKAFLRSRRHRARIIPSPRMLQPGSYVLYLRSFEDDQARTALHQHALPGAVGGILGFALSGRSAEEHIADALRPVGPLIAVGAPGERLPHVGAVRMYLPKEQWREPVRQLMRRSRLTVLTLGRSEGTMWELAEAMRLLPPQRLLLVIPSMGRQEYEHIRRATDAALRPRTSAAPEGVVASGIPGSRLPECPKWLEHADRSSEPVQGLIHFSSDWAPTLTPVMGTSNEGRWNLFSALLPGLDKTFTPLADYEKQAGRHCG